jgi:hypothetical protein
MLQIQYCQFYVSPIYESELIHTFSTSSLLSRCQNGRWLSEEHRSEDETWRTVEALSD